MIFSDITNTTTPTTGIISKKWTAEEDRTLIAAVDKCGARNWKHIAAIVSGRTHAQCLQRWMKVLKPGLKKGQWTVAEDKQLTKLVGSGWESWPLIADQIPGRTSKQCRERWFHHLDPTIDRTPYTEEEDKQILATHASRGGKWAHIAKVLTAAKGTGQRRTAEAIKIRFKTLDRHHKSGASCACPQVVRHRQPYVGPSARTQNQNKRSFDAVTECDSGYSSSDSGSSVEEDFAEVLKTDFDLTFDLTSSADAQFKKQKTVHAVAQSVEDLRFPSFSAEQQDDLDMIEQLLGSSTGECAIAANSCDLDLGLDFLGEEEDSELLTAQDIDSFLSDLA
jgi:myb proto-oncogene protein